MLKKIIFMAFLIAMVSGCSLQRSPVLNTVDFTKVDFSKSESFKEGQACATYIFGIIGPFGDPTVMTAIKNGGLKSVNVVDYKASWNPLFTKSCVVVYGSK